MVGDVSRELENRVFPWSFVHVSQSEGQIRGHVTSTWAFLKEMQEHHNGRDSHQVRYNSPYRGVGPQPRGK